MWGVAVGGGKNATSGGEKSNHAGYAGLASPQQGHFAGKGIFGEDNRGIVGAIDSLGILDVIL